MSVRLYCRCAERVYCDFVASTPIPLLEVSNAWSVINNTFRLGKLSECTLQSVRDSCFIVRFTKGNFQAFAQALKRNDAAAFWRIRQHGLRDSYTLHSNIEVKMNGDVLVSFSMICDVSNSYIQSRCTFDQPAVYDSFVSEFTDKRLGAPALIAWSPRCVVFRTVINPHSALQSPIKRTPTSPSNQTRATVSKGVIVLTPKSSKQTPICSTTSSTSQDILPQQYSYQYILCERPLSPFEQNDIEDNYSNSDETELEEVVPPIFPVSCRAMIDLYSHYVSSYCISSAYMFSSLDVLQGLTSLDLLDEVIACMDPLVQKAQDFTLSCTDFTDQSHCDTSEDDLTTPSSANVSADDITSITLEPPLRHTSTEIGQGEEEMKNATLMVECVIRRLKEAYSSIYENINEQDDQLIALGGAESSNSSSMVSKLTPTDKYLRLMPLHYPMLAIPCPDAKPYVSEEYLLKSIAHNSLAGIPPKMRSYEAPYDLHSNLKSIEDVIKHLCTIIVDTKQRLERLERLETDR